MQFPPVIILIDVIITTDDPLEVRVTTVGGPLPGVECKIIDPETGEECPDGVNGEFVARGYNIMKGYYKMPLATAQAIDEDDSYPLFPDAIPCSFNQLIGG